MTRFAQKTWRKTNLRSMLSQPDTAGLVSMYDFSRGLKDWIGSNDGTRFRGVDTGIKTILGTAAAGWSNGVVNLGTGFNTQTNFFCSFWYRHITTPNLRFIVSQYLDASNGFGLIATGDVLSVYDDISNAGASKYSFTLVNGALYHIVFGINSSNICKLWVNGVPAANNVAAAAGFNTVGGSLYLFSRYNIQLFSSSGSISNLEVYSSDKTDTDALELYSRGAKAIQFATDWGHKADGIARSGNEYIGEGPLG